MMYLSLVFWAALGLPGFALVRRLFADELRSGPLGVLALSYLASFALLSPVAIVLYAVESPLAVFSAAVVAAIAVAVVELSRRGGWGDIARLAKSPGGAALALLAVAVTLVIDLRSGGFLGGDAVVHLSRVRFLVDHGITNRDPFVSERHFFPIYHTNLLHALYASATQLTRMNHLDVWYASLPWARLMVISGSYYLAWVIFQRTTIAWLAAAFCLAARGPITFAMYPNQLCPYWLLPMLLAFAIRAAQLGPCGADAGRIAATVIVAGTLHALYAAIAVLAAGPILAWAAIRQVRTRGNQGGPVAPWPALVCLVALMAGLPFGLMSKLKTPPMKEKQLAYDVTPEATGDYAELPGGGLVRRAATLPAFFGGSLAGTVALAIGLACACRLGPPVRGRAALLMAAPATAAALLYVPATCSLLLRAFGQEWVVARYEVVTALAFYALAPTAIAAMIEQAASGAMTNRASGGALLREGLCLATVAGAYFHTNYEPPWTWADAIQTARLPADERRGKLRELHRVGEFARKYLPPGAVVLTEPVASLWFTMVADCRIIASASASNGVPELDRRLKDLSIMLRADTHWPTRRALLRQYHVEYYVPMVGMSSDWVRPRVAELMQSNGMTLVRLKID